jgi:DNA-binding response OmpR family regulator
MLTLVPVPPVNVGPYLFYAAEDLLVDRRRQHEIYLTKKESDLLIYLYDANNRSVSQHEILQNVWGYSINATSVTVRTHICRLRKKMEDAPSKLQLLSTESRGYRLERESSLAEICLG